MRTRFKPWAKPYLEQHRDIVVDDLAFDQAFFVHDDLRMEIGCGKGDFVVTMAEKNSTVHFLAVEVSPMVAAMAVRKIVEKGLLNIRILVADVAHILPQCRDEMFSALYLNFSDPWPKRRHEKRRLTYPQKLLEYKRIIKDGGYIYYKSDNDEFYHYSLEMFTNSPFTVISNTSNYQPLNEDDAMSEYERLFRNEGKNINRIVARRK